MTCYNECMSEDQFTKLFSFVQEMRTEMNERFDQASHRSDDIGGVLGELSAQVRDYHSESIFLNNHVDKLTEAIKQIAKETGVKLKVEL